MVSSLKESLDANLESFASYLDYRYWNSLGSAADQFNGAVLAFVKTDTYVTVAKATGRVLGENAASLYLMANGERNFSQEFPNVNGWIFQPRTMLAQEVAAAEGTYLDAGVWASGNFYRGFDSLVNHIAPAIPQAVLIAYGVGPSIARGKTVGEFATSSLSGFLNTGDRLFEKTFGSIPPGGLTPSGQVIAVAVDADAAVSVAASSSSPHFLGLSFSVTMGPKSTTQFENAFKNWIEGKGLNEAQAREVLAVARSYYEQWGDRGVKGVHRDSFDRPRGGKSFTMNDAFERALQDWERGQRVAAKKATTLRGVEQRQALLDDTVLLSRVLGEAFDQLLNDLRSQIPSFVAKFESSREALLVDAEKIFRTRPRIKNPSEAVGIAAQQLFLAGRDIDALYAQYVQLRAGKKALSIGYFSSPSFWQGTTHLLVFPNNVLGRLVQIQERGLLPGVQIQWEGQTYKILSVNENCLLNVKLPSGGPVRSLEPKVLVRTDPQ